MPLMTKKKQKPVRSGAALHVWIDPDIMRALNIYLAGTNPSVFKTAAVEAALRDFLAAKGCWPPPPPDQRV